MKLFLALAFVFSTSAAFACDHDQASKNDGTRTVASKAEAGKATTDGGSCGEEGCSCAKHNKKECHCKHEKHDKACGCGECHGGEKGKTTS